MGWTQWVNFLQTKPTKKNYSYDLPGLVWPPNPSKISEKRKKYNKKYSQLLMYTTGIEKKQYMCRPGINLYTPDAHDTVRIHEKVFSQSKLFLELKEPGSFKKCKKSVEM